jgi:hypothetical protein
MTVSIADWPLSISNLKEPANGIQIGNWQMPIGNK